LPSSVPDTEKRGGGRGGSERERGREREGERERGGEGEGGSGCESEVRGRGRKERGRREGTKEGRREGEGEQRDGGTERKREIDREKSAGAHAKRIHTHTGHKRARCSQTHTQWKQQRQFYHTHAQVREKHAPTKPTHKLRHTNLVLSYRIVARVGLHPVWPVTPT
jgi:hypothetical protein